MSLSHKFRNGLMATAAIGACALGGSALAGAATTNSSSTQSTAAATQSSSSSSTQAPAQRDPTQPGGHVGSNGKSEQALPSDVAAKVKAAAEAKVSGGTVQRVETDVDHGSPYEAHVTKADGTQLEVLVDSNFKVTAVNTMGRP
jgi:uncharacterized membrane protein YkoI